MTLSDLYTPWLLPTLSLLTATTSNLISPNGRKSFVEDVKSNTLAFSPFRFGATAIALILELIGCRVLNLAQIHVLLGLLVPHHDRLDLDRGVWPAFARRAFLIGVTLPLYMMLMAFASHRWIQVFTTLVVAEPVLAELLTFRGRASFEVRGDWPHSVLLVKSLAPSDRLDRDHFENESKSSETEENQQLPTPSRDNLCDRVHQLCPPSAQPVIFTSQSLPLENNPKLKKIFNPTIPVQWTCGHSRCLVYKILHLAVGAISKLWAILELASTTWLLHYEMQPVTLQIADKLWQSHLVYGILATLYDLCGVILIAIFGYISATLLLNRLVIPLSTRLFIHLSKHSLRLQRMHRKLQDLAQAAPITYNVLNVCRALLMQGIPCWYIGHALAFLAPRHEGFTQEFLSYLIEGIVIPAIYVIVYCLVCSMTRADQAGPELHAHLNAGQSAEHSIASDRNCGNVQNAAATDSSSADSSEEDKTPKAGLESSRALKEFRSTILRLAILVGTGTIWVFLFL